MHESPVIERPLVFASRGEDLVGVLHMPAAAADTAVVIVVGGPQYRAGSHRQFVLLARRIANEGIGVLRFDYGGMGDSSGNRRSFENVGADIAAAIDAVQQHEPHIRRIVLWGLCDAASAALLYCGKQSDPRVVGLALANPWVRSDTSLARTHVKHYYAPRLLQRDFWLKLLSGQMGLTAVRGLVRNLMLSHSRTEAQLKTSFQRRMAAAWFDFRGEILLLLSSADYTAKEFLEHTSSSPAWSKSLERSLLERCDFAGADHTFSASDSRMAMEDCTVAWLKRRFPQVSNSRTSKPSRVLMEQ